MTTPDKLPKNIGIDVYLHEALFARIAQLASTHGRSHSAVCRELIALGLESSGASMDTDGLAALTEELRKLRAAVARVEKVAAVAVAVPLIATADSSLTDTESLDRARGITRSATRAAPGVLRQILQEESNAQRRGVNLPDVVSGRGSVEFDQQPAGASE